VLSGSVAGAGGFAFHRPLLCAASRNGQTGVVQQVERALSSFFTRPDYSGGIGPPAGD